jgi:hypothetical protein
MRCILLENDAEKYATNLRFNEQTKNLIWDSAPGQDVVIVQTPYGDSVNSILEDLSSAVENMDSLPGRYSEVINGVWICFVSAKDKVHDNGCKINGEGSTYTVLSCSKRGDELSLYKPSTKGMISPSVDIPRKIHIQVNKESTQKPSGIFGRILKGKENSQSCFYSICFPEKMDEGYKEGEMSYTIGNTEIPITKAMVMQRVVYVRSEELPKIKTANKGIRLI